MTARMSEANLKEIAEAREAEAPSQKSGRSGGAVRGAVLQPPEPGWLGGAFQLSG